MTKHSQPGDLRVNRESDRQLITAIRQTIKGGRLAGGSSSAILGQIESLLAGVETFLGAAGGEHIDRVSVCLTCGGWIEHVAGTDDTDWRHIGADTTHAAEPTALSVEDVAPRGTNAAEDHDPAVASTDHEGWGHERGRPGWNATSGEQPTVDLPPIRSDETIGRPEDIGRACREDRCGHDHATVPHAATEEQR